MLKYIYVAAALFVAAVFSYVGYVFYDRAEAKKTIAKKESVIQTKIVEVDLAGVAEKAKGQIEQIDKEDNNEADISFGVHHYTF